MEYGSIEHCAELIAERDALLELEADCAIEKQKLAEQNAKMLAMLKDIYDELEVKDATSLGQLIAEIEHN